MRFAGDGLRSRIIDVDLTSMIDVVFLLIVFFMTTAQFARMTKAEVDLPDEPGEQRAGDEEGAIVINVAGDGSIIVGRQTVSYDQLMRMVAAEAARSGGPALVDLVIRADQSLDAQTVNRIAEGLADLGVRSWRLATAPAEAR
ncbi:MAG: ExbD/TolR family protein [Phycisphaerales bacterium]